MTALAMSSHCSCGSAPMPSEVWQLGQSYDTRAKVRPNSLMLRPVTGVMDAALNCFLQYGHKLMDSLLSVGSGVEIASCHKGESAYLAHVSTPPGGEGHDHASTSARASIAARCRLHAYAATAATHDEQLSAHPHQRNNVGRGVLQH